MKIHPIILVGLGGLGIAALALIKKPGAEPPTKSTENLRKLAIALLGYVNKGGTDNNKIKSYQKKIGAKLTGKPDSQTEKRIEAILGYDVSWLPKRKVVKPKVFTSPAKKPAAKGPLERLLTDLGATKKADKKASPAVKPPPKKQAATVTPKLLPKSTTKPLPIPKQVPTTVPDSVRAAIALDGYLRQGGLNRARVRDYQRRMGGLALDGVPGPQTKARAETLLSRSLSWPGQNAAEDLRVYYRGGGRDRTKIKAFQQSMGELGLDGLVGPKTKKRYKALTGKVF